MTRPVPYKIRIALALVVLVVLLSGCLRLEHSGQVTNSKRVAKYELSKVDIFSLEQPWSGEDVSVFGVQLGDTKDDVIEKVGLPDLKTEYPGSTNFEYSRGLAMPKIGLLFHFTGDTLTRMTFKEPFNRFLHGKTKIGALDKDAIYREFKAPSKLQLLTFFTMYTYKDKGLEIFLNGRKMNGFSLVSQEGITELAETPERNKKIAKHQKLAQVKKDVFGEEAE